MGTRWKTRKKETALLLKPEKENESLHLKAHNSHLTQYIVSMTNILWVLQSQYILLNVTSPFILHFVSVYLLMQFHLLLFILKINLCPSIELHQIECDKGNFLAIMMSVQSVSTQGMEMSLGTGKGILIDTTIHTMNAKDILRERKTCQANQIFPSKVKARRVALTL